MNIHAEAISKRSLEDLTPEWLEGIRAFEKGIQRDACPYTNGSTRAASWIEGFETATAVLALCPKYLLPQA